MAIYNRLILGGSLFGVERWSTAITYILDPVVGPDNAIERYDDLLDWAQRVKDEKFDAGTPGAALLPLLSSNGNIDTVRTEFRRDGVLEQAAQATGSPIPGSGGSLFPPQISLVISLLTGRPGRSYRGRMYWPCIGGISINNTGMASPSTIATLAGKVAAALPDFGERSMSADLVPVVYSPKLNEFTNVTSIAIGTALDTQRRRRDALVESYAEEPLA